MMQKNAFEWGSSVIPHSYDAIQVTQHAANFFVGYAPNNSSVDSLFFYQFNIIKNGVYESKNVVSFKV